MHLDYTKRHATLIDHFVVAREPVEPKAPAVAVAPFVDTKQRAAGLMFSAQL